MAEHVTVNIVHDDSVDKLLAKTAKSLKKKYTTKRTINEKFLKNRTPIQKAFIIIGDIICTLLVLFAGLVCFSGLNSRIQKVCPTFAGYSNMTIQSGSMVASGFKIGDKITVKSVNTYTLHEGDIIAFYVYSNDYQSFDINSCIKIEDDEIPETVYTTSFASLLGIQTNEIKTAAKAGSKLVFHHIRSVFQDENGVRWFKTYGSSNMLDDAWYISENMVVGKYVDDSTSSIFAKMIAATNSKLGFLILLIPVALLAVIIVIESLRDVQMAKLELDCVEEKRKITDPICVKYNVGYNMDTKTKYKILAQAAPEEINLYLSLLWRNNSVPTLIRKYYTRKNILINYNRKMALLNRECEEMFKNGEKPNTIAKYYREKKAALQEEQIKKERELRTYIKSV